MSGKTSNRAIVPAARPRITSPEFMAIMAAHQAKLAGCRLWVGGLRAYYEDSMGKPGENDRGIYDDAIVAVIDGQIYAFNGNTDPSRFEAGSGTGAGKGMAVLKPGLYNVHRLDIHRRGTPGAHLALCQRAGPVTVLRDGREEPYADSGNFGINIHRGGRGTTSSLGCQTLYAEQWPEFIGLVERAARRFYGPAWNTTIIPYALVDVSK